MKKAKIKKPSFYILKNGKQVKLPVKSMAYKILENYLAHRNIMTQENPSMVCPHCGTTELLCGHNGQQGCCTIKK